MFQSIKEQLIGKKANKKKTKKTTTTKSKHKTYLNLFN